MGAYRVSVRGVVQGVGFRPFVFHAARRYGLAGWVLNGGDGAEIHLEGDDGAVAACIRYLTETPPPLAVIAAIDTTSVAEEGATDFAIRQSAPAPAPSACILPDLPVCDDCLRELFDPTDRRFGYPYINCTNCGPRYSVMLALPYDRANTTVRRWPLTGACAAEYGDPENRRFHAEPVACAECGPQYVLGEAAGVSTGGRDPIVRAATMLRAGNILAIKGLGGYHLACDARNEGAVAALRGRKYRKEKPFALMVQDGVTAQAIVTLTETAAALLASRARPIVLAPARVALPGVAPGTTELGVMLAYAPVHHLLFAAGAPDILVMTSANRSSEPMAYEDDVAAVELAGIADGFLVGERPIARRMDDSVARDGPCGPVILRRARGYAPEAVSTFPESQPLLAVGSDLKNTVTLVVATQAIVSQHIGDLGHFGARVAFERTVSDLLAMYRIEPAQLEVVHDAHPEHASSVFARALPCAAVRAVQHHRAHVASVLAERQAWSRLVIGLALDGTGYGDDGTIWGGEVFAGSVEAGLKRVAHLRPAELAGGDGAAVHPVQAAAGFLAQIDGLPDLRSTPFGFPGRYDLSRALLTSGTRTCVTTSMGRLFDTAAALLGFTRAMTYEGQAAMWLEQLAMGAGRSDPYEFPFDGRELDFRPLLERVVADRRTGREPSTIARSFHAGVAQGLADAVAVLAEVHGARTVVASGGVMQNTLLLADLSAACDAARLTLWVNQRVPPNDGGISLGQAALAAFGSIAAESDREGQVESAPCTNSRSR